MRFIQNEFTFKRNAKFCRTAVPTTAEAHGGRTAATGVRMIRKQAGGIVPVPKRNPKDTFRRHLIKAHPMPIIRTALPRGKPESLISGEGKLAMARIGSRRRSDCLRVLKFAAFDKTKGFAHTKNQVVEQDCIDCEQS